MICEHDVEVRKLCRKALEPAYDVIIARNMKECINRFVRMDERPDLLLSAYLLKDGTGGDVARQMNEIAVTKVILMSEEDIGVSVLEPLYADGCLHDTILKPFNDNYLHELITRTLAKCPICHGSVLGNTRELPCSYCNGSGRYTTTGYRFLMHHHCDCCNSARCDICTKPCHHMRT